MSLLHRPLGHDHPHPCCWVATGDQADGPTCRAHLEIAPRRFLDRGGDWMDLSTVLDVDDPDRPEGGTPGADRDRGEG